MRAAGLTACVLLIPENDYISFALYHAVELARLVNHLDLESLFVAVKLYIFRHSPRVPAGAVSAEGHHALGHNFAVTAAYDNPRIKRFPHAT
jgi:hypothetical protein